MSFHIEISEEKKPTTIHYAPTYAGLRDQNPVVWTVVVILCGIVSESLELTTGAHQVFFITSRRYIF